MTITDPLLTGGNEDNSSSRSKGRRRRKWPKMTPIISYIVGEDISWESMETLVNFNLVGHFMGKTLSVRVVNSWVNDCSMGDLGVVPKVDRLA